LNWYPNRTYLLTGKYSTPSKYCFAGVGLEGSDCRILPSIYYLEYTI